MRWNYVLDILTLLHGIFPFGSLCSLRYIFDISYYVTNVDDAIDLVAEKFILLRPDKELFCPFCAREKQ